MLDEMELLVPFGKPRQFGIDVVAQALVEPARLKVERIQSRMATAASSRNGFGLGDESTTVPLRAARWLHPQRVDGEPCPGSGRHQAGDQAAILVHREGQRGIAARLV